MEKIHSTKSKDIICNVIHGVENFFGAESPKRIGYINLYSAQIDELIANSPAASDERDRLHDGLRELQKAVVRFLATPSAMRDETELRDLVENYEPSESEQGFVPIQNGYAEQ